MAKVVRDRMMARLAARYPGYGWEHNQGYATLEHRAGDPARSGSRRSTAARSSPSSGRSPATSWSFDLLADPAASAETHELLARELVPVMADDSMLDALDLASLELTAPA